MPPMNDPVPVSAVRRPRLRLLAGGEPVHGCVEASVVSNSHLAADTWSATLAIGPDPSRGAEWWADAADADAEVEVQFGFLPAGAPEGDAPWESLIVGTIDDVDIDLERGLVQVRGRDLTARLIEAQTTATHSNLTASQLAEQIAGKHGLEADVQATTALIGQYYAHEHTSTSLAEFSRATTDWDVLTALAEREGLEVAVERRRLVLRPAADPDRTSPFLVSWVPGTLALGGVAGTSTATAPGCGAADLSLRRSLGLARDIEVTVRSRNARSGANVEVTLRGARRARASGTQPRRRRGAAARDDELDAFLADRGLTRAESGVAEDTATVVRSGAARGQAAAAPRRADAQVSRYVFTRPNLTSDEALQLARTKLQDLTRHERAISFSMPGELTLTARTVVRLGGTGTAFDQDYFVDEIERSLSFEQGFTQRVRCKNSSPRATETALA